jgi:hypothetical protein
MCLLTFLCLMAAGHSNLLVSNREGGEFAVDRQLVSTIRFDYFGRCTAQMTEIFRLSPYLRLEHLKIDEVRKELDLSSSQESRIQKLIGKEREAMTNYENEKNGTLDERFESYVAVCAELRAS